MMSLVGCSGEEFQGILKSLGFRIQKKMVPAPPPPPLPEGAEPPAEAPPSEMEIDIWWPKDTGPFRENHPKPKPKPEKRERTKPKRPERIERPRKPEKPVDPNSPFAVLGALKAQMAGSKP
jgi:ATP-dependent RNA helicase SUPV3L1/SUV3